MSLSNSKTMISDYSLNMLKPGRNEAGIVFLSGGSALAEVSEHLSKWQIPSVHLITPFDSGGSSMPLRSAFDMPAVGDIRNRILSLARIDRVGAALPELCALRLDKSLPEYVLRNQLKELASGRQAVMLRLEDERRIQVMHWLSAFIKHMPDDFSLKGASLGNLLIVGAYLALGRDLYAAVEEISELLQVEGAVLPVVDNVLHLAARLSDGRVIVGQHLITGKETPSPELPIKEVYLTPAWPGGDATPRIAHPEIRPEVSRLLKSASCICYPMGSFYSSLVANLLPGGVGAAISQAQCYKVYVPNAASDPEASSLSVDEQVAELLHYLRLDAGSDIPAGRLITHVFYDSGAEYHGGINVERIQAMGVEVASVDLLYSGYSKIHFEPYLFLHALAELISLKD
ncbi:MAG: GAK system CofD-like protein [Desulfovibrionaceae bacterium]|nr:GAK system CofD-like protein [Desulfovibrionaceae bacterium]